MKVYLSGRITGRIPEARLEFRDAQRRLEALGHSVVNPFGNGLGDDDAWERHLAVDIIHLMECDALCQLPGWEESLGARLENEIAVLKGIPRLCMTNKMNVAI